MSGARGYYITNDNAQIYTAVVENNLRDAGYVLLRLPPWSPFLNSIEEMFSNLKADVKKHSLTSHGDLLVRILQSSNHPTRSPSKMVQLGLAIRCDISICALQMKTGSKP